MCTHILHITSLSIHLDYFHILTVVNNAGVNIEVHLSLLLHVYIEIEGVLVVSFCLFVFDCTMWHVRSYFPDQESNPAPCSGNRVLTIGSPENFPKLNFYLCGF